jgi:hypothetical protein
MQYALPDVGSIDWYATPLNAAVADLDRRTHAIESTGGPAGTQGTRWFAVTGTPDASLGEIGDFALDSSGGIWQKTATN